MTRILISVPELRKLVRYDAKTGKLFWLPRPDSMFSREWHARVWNTKWAGQETFLTPHRGGAVKGTIYSDVYQAQEIAWALYTGAWPTGRLHHVNGDKSDNRIRNLRDVPIEMRRDTTPRYSGSASGHVGVHWLPGKSKWAAYIWMDGKRDRLGYFKHLSDAVDARRAAEAAKAAREADIIAGGVAVRRR